MVHDPKPRSIHKAMVRDRLLHQAIYRLIYPSFDPSYIYDSYSCRDNKSTHRAFQQLVRYCRKVSRNHTSACFALQMDIHKIFDSIDHNVLMSLLQKRIAYPKVLELLKNILRSF